MERELLHSAWAGALDDSSSTDGAGLFGLALRVAAPSVPTSVERATPVPRIGTGDDCTIEVVVCP